MTFTQSAFMLCFAIYLVNLSCTAPTNDGFGAHMRREVRDGKPVIWYWFNAQKDAPLCFPALMAFKKDASGAKDLARAASKAVVATPGLVGDGNQHIFVLPLGVHGELEAPPDSAPVRFATAIKECWDATAPMTSPCVVRGDVLPRVLKVEKVSDIKGDTKSAIEEKRARLSGCYDVSDENLDRVRALAGGIVLLVDDDFNSRASMEVALKALEDARERARVDFKIECVVMARCVDSFYPKVPMAELDEDAYALVAAVLWSV